MRHFESIFCLRHKRQKWPLLDSRLYYKFEARKIIHNSFH